jgi:hypothetical protein
MLSGRRAFEHSSSIEILSAILRDEPMPLDAPSNVSAIVTRRLRKRPEERFRTITEVRAALETASIDRPAAKQSSVAVLPLHAHPHFLLVRKTTIV